MADYTATTNMTLEACITAGPMTSGDNLTINAGAIVTCSQTPSILIGMVNINDGKLLVDGVNIVTGNMINFVGDNQQEIDVAGQGTFEVNGDWYDIGTTDGTNSQTFNLATYYDSSFCVDVVPMIQIETGRRIDFDNSSGTAPEIDDYVRKASNYSILGRITQVESAYLIVKYLTGALVDNDDIEVRKIIDNNGPDMQVSWTATVNNASGDIKQSGIYQEFGNSRSNGVSYISAYHHGVGGFTFDNAFQSTTITMGTAAGTVGGFVPPSGCNVRVPNVHFSTSNTTNYASNNTYHDGTNNESNWYNMDTGSGGIVDISICNMGGAFFQSDAAFSYSCEYVGATIGMGINICASKVLINNCVIVQDPMNTAIADGRTTNCVDNFYGMDFKNCLILISRIMRGPIIATSKNVTFYGSIVSSAAAASGEVASNHCVYFTECVDIVFNNNIIIGNNNAEQDNLIYIVETRNFEANNIMLCATQDETEQTIEQEAIYIADANTIEIVGIEFLGNGTMGDRCIMFTDTSNVKIRCLGMIDDKVDFQTDGENVIYTVGFCENLDFARMWTIGGITTNQYVITYSVKSVIIQNCSGKYAALFNPSGFDDVVFKGVHAGSGLPGSTTGIEDTYTSRYGRQIHDGFRSDTVGYITCVMITPSALIDNTTVTSGNPKFFKNGDLDMVSGDVIEFEMDYFARGHISFPGTYTSTVGSSSWNANEWTNVTLDFQYDIGSGWSGTWLDVRTASNWTGITITAATGVKLKFRFTATGTQNDMSMLIIDTVTSIAVQKANFYPIDQVECDVILKGIVVDSR
ncbi:hypothetical protein KAR91_16905, partial [Candidatus Pacearchaeota archaeon]|nr:hypothetical protein [Candidatus Pacearchaeota archaeon]